MDDVRVSMPFVQQRQQESAAALLDCRSVGKTVIKERRSDAKRGAAAQMLVPMEWCNYPDGYTRPLSQPNGNLAKVPADSSISLCKKNLVVVNDFHGVDFPKSNPIPTKLQLQLQLQLNWSYFVVVVVVVVTLMLAGRTSLK